MRVFDGFQKGVNLGGWISQFDKYDIEHFDSFITEKDISYIASLGFDHVRVPVDYNVLETEEGELIESGFTYLSNCLSWCQKHGLHMLIDLHECFGYSFDPLKETMDRRAFFYSEPLQERFLKLWSEIARRFGQYPDDVAFEPLNEVVLYEVKDAWNDLIRRFISTIRPLAPRNWLLIGGVCSDAVFAIKLLDPPADDRVAYNFHCYEPLVFTHQGAYWVKEMPRDYRLSYPMPVEEYRRITTEMFGFTEGPLFHPELKQMDASFFELIFADAIAAAEKFDAPLYCGEYGTIDLANNEDKLRWLTDIHTAFKKHNIGRALWNYKEKDFGLVDEAFASIKDQFIASL